MLRTTPPPVLSVLATPAGSMEVCLGLAPWTSEVRSTPLPLQTGVWDWVPKDGMIGKPVAELSERAGRAPIRAASLAHPVPEASSSPGGGGCPQRGPKRQLGPDVSTCDVSARPATQGSRKSFDSPLSQPATPQSPLSPLKNGYKESGPPHILGLLWE